MTDRKHRVQGVPIKPSQTVNDAWESFCNCGYGITADSPEAAIVAMAHHLKGAEIDESR